MTKVPWKATLDISLICNFSWPWPVTVATCFSFWTGSPVKLLSSTDSSLTRASRTSAGTRSPTSKLTISPVNKKKNRVRLLKNSQFNAQLIYEIQIHYDQIIPGTRYLARILWYWPSLNTLHVGGKRAPIRSKVFSDRYSWTNPTVTTMIMANAIEAASSNCLINMLKK